MSGNVRTFKLASGGYADVPEDQINSWMQEMDESGVKFTTADVTADMQVGEPEVIKSPPPAPEPSMADRFLSGARGYAQDFGRAGEGFVRGLNQSLYQGGADEFAAAGRAAGGEDFGAALKGEQAARDQAWNDTPLTYGAGRALGYVPGMMIGGPMGAGVKAAAGRVGINSMQALINGFLSDDGDLASRAQAGGRDALIAAPFGVAGELMSKAGPAIDRGGVAMRAANARGAQGEMNAVRQNQGLEQMQHGVDQDFADLGLASSWKPQSAYGVAKKLGAPTPEGTPPGMIRDAGEQMGGALDAATDAGARGSWDSVRQLQDNSVRAALGGPVPPTISQRGYANEMQRIAGDEFPAPSSMPMNRFDPEASYPPVGVPAGAPVGPPPSTGGGFADSMVLNKVNAQRDRLNEPFTVPTPDAVPQGNLGNPVRQQARPNMQPYEDWLAPIKNAADEASPRELQALKQKFETEGYPREGTVRLEGDSPRAQAYQDSATNVRRELTDTMQGQSFNDFYPDFKQGRETIEMATPIADMAGTRAASNKSASGFSNPWNYAAATAGASVGGMAGGVPGAIGGAVLGAGGNYLGRNYGQDIAGMGMRGIGQGMEGTGNAMQALGRAAGPVSGVAGATEPDRGGDPGAQAQREIENGRGYMLTDVVMDALRNEPQLLGRYASQFGQAMGAGGNRQDEISALITRLSHTDPDFRVNVLPALRARTGGM
jgi:hypothetical protein